MSGVEFKPNSIVWWEPVKRTDNTCSLYSLSHHQLSQSSPLPSWQSIEGSLLFLPMALNSKVIPQRIQLLALGRRRRFTLWHLGTTIPPGWKMNTVHANSWPALGEARPAPFSANTTNYRCVFATWPMLMFTLWWFLRGVCAHTNSMLFWLNYKRLLSKILSRTL